METTQKVSDPAPLPADALVCENDGCHALVERCDCGGAVCAGWGHVTGSRHWCPPDWKSQPYPLPRRSYRVRVYGGYRLPPGRRGSTT